MLSSRKRSKRSKAFYKSAPFKKRSHSTSLHNGTRGFLVTTSGNEAKAIAEVCSLLEETYANSVVETVESDKEKEDLDPGGTDVLKSLKDELAAMKCPKMKSSARFSPVNSGARGVLFITCSDDVQPCELVHTIFEDLYDKRKQNVRFCARLVPVSLVCPAYVDDIKKTARGILKEFHGEPAKVLKYCIVYKARNNSTMDRSTVISALVDAVTLEGKYSHKVDLLAPERVIIVEIIKSHCCISVVKDYFRFKKYNLHEVVKNADSRES